VHSLSLAEEPWIGGFNEFSAPPAEKDAFPGLTAAGHAPLPDSGFLGRAVGSVHEPTLVKFWKETFERDIYVENILRLGYKIPVKMSTEEATKTYREKNNKSARDEMPFVRSEVKRLVESGQVIQVDSAPRCTNPLSVAFKINSDGSIKKRLVIDLSRWVNEFIVLDRFKMARFQDALSQAAPGDFQSVYDISKAYHHLRLHPDSYELVGFCVVDEEGKECFYHYVVVVFGLGPAGQLLGRMMRPILRKLSEMGIRNVMYVNDGWVVASTNVKADADYAIAVFYFKLAGFIVPVEKSDPVGAASQRKEYLGFLFDTKAMIVEAPRQKMLRIKDLLEKFLTSNTHKVRKIAA
jgi:tRNA(Phe) wybutosine-synthesizing methylase Tyw3